MKTSVHFETDPNQFGTHEMMEFCEMIGAKPWFNINMMTGSPSEMREWMEYCNRQRADGTFAGTKNKRP